MCDSFSQYEGSEFMAQSMQEHSVSCPGRSYWKIQVFSGSDQEKKNTADRSKNLLK